VGPALLGWGPKIANGIFAVGTYFNSRGAALLGMGFALWENYNNTFDYLSGRSNDFDIGKTLLMIFLALGTVCGVAGTFRTVNLSRQFSAYAYKDADHLRLWGYWDTFAWAFLAFLIGQLIAMITVTLLFFPQIQLINLDFADVIVVIRKELELEGPPVSVAGLVLNSVMIAVLLVAVRIAEANPVQYLGLVWTRGRHLVFGVAGIFVIIGITHTLSFLSGYAGRVPFDPETYTKTATGWLPATLILRTVVAPAGEEIMFRGFLFRGWARSQRSVLLTVFASSLLCSAIYAAYHWTVLVEVFLVGLLLGWMRWRSGSTLLTFFLNALFNAETTMETALRVNFLS
jgi:membrane protease YdiL (CAAX protease family)